MLHKLDANDLHDVVELDSSGTSGWHVDAPADPRSRQAAQARGISLTSRSRKVRDADFDEFDYLIAMDTTNLDELAALRGSWTRRTIDGVVVYEDTEGARARLALLRAFDPSAEPGASVPDPYYGGDRGFEDVLDICERGCTGLLEHIRSQHGLDPT